MNKKKLGIWQRKAKKIGWDLKEDNNLYVFSNITNLYARSDNKTFLDNAAVFGMNLKNMKKCLRGVK